MDGFTMLNLPDDRGRKGYLRILVAKMPLATMEDMVLPGGCRLATEEGIIWLHSTQTPFNRGRYNLSALQPPSTRERNPSNC